MRRSELRILSYNIHAGIGMDARLDVDRLAKVIVQTRPDLVSLQEVDRGTRRSGGEDQWAALKEATGMHGIFGKSIDHDGGAYGLAMFSRWPLFKVQSHFLPVFPGDEKRVAVAASVTPGEGWPELLFVGTHLSWLYPEVILEQSRQLNAWFALPTSQFRILAGDLNAVPESPPIQELKRQWSDGKALEPTFPADYPERKIDYIMTGPGLNVIRTTVLNERFASDHRPLLSVITLAAA